MSRHVTKFGTALDTPELSVRAVRATASRYGTVLAPVSALDAVAAVIGAEIWMVVTNTLALTDAGGQTAAETEAMACVLMRAAGQAKAAQISACVVPEIGTAPDFILPTVDNLTEWAEEQLGTPDAARRALRLAADDLARPGASGRMATAAAILFAAS